MDANSYPIGREVTVEQMEAISIKKDKFHGEWNYTILPKAKNGWVILASRLSDALAVRDDEN